MLRETLSMVRDLPRLHEITSVLIRYGWGDFVRLLGIANLLERAGRLLHWKTSNEIVQLDLPVRIRLALTELGPSFVKLGQILATRVDVFPASWIVEFEKLHSNVPPVPFELLQGELEQVLGNSVDNVFSAFDREPFAAASIAQVHRARLPDGVSVVVKIRRPDIHAKIDADLRILTHLARLMEMEMPDMRRYRVVQIVGQLQRLLDDADRHQHPVDQPGLLQQHHPGIGPRQKVGPHRQQDDREDDARDTLRHDDQRPSHRKGDKRGDQGHDARDQKGIEEDP